MFPIILDTDHLKMVLIGKGEGTERRKKLCRKLGYVPKCYMTIPDAEDLNNVDIIFGADLNEEESGRLYHLGKAAGALVNIEDNRRYCDFHVPAMVSRGDLLLTVSTAGKSPRLASLLRQEFEVRFGEEWAERLDILAQERDMWKAQGASYHELMDKTDALLKERGWLSCLNTA